MKYFTFDLWTKYPEEWDENALKYNTYFETIKGNLPNSFLKLYNEFSGFHDFEIYNMIVQNRIFVLKIKKRTTKICITYNNFQSLICNSNLEGENLQISQNLEWGYDEFLLEGSELLSHSIITSSGLELNISFESIDAWKEDE